MMHADGVCVAQFIQCFKEEPPKTNQPTEKNSKPKKTQTKLQINKIIFRLKILFFSWKKLVVMQQAVKSNLAM